MTDPLNFLITGGTGTFGRAFTRHLLENDLAQRITIFSRGEVKQSQMEAEFNHDPRLRFFIGDVRDYRRLRRAFQGVDAVIAAAALKQVDRSASEADEFFKTIDIGAHHIIEAAHERGVKKVVALSTDKAVEATTPYGSFKSVAEHLFIGGCAWGSSKFSLIRYGNVLGSRGSVLELWEKQAKEQGRLTITDPDMTRFWLPIQEAVSLALLALDRMRGGEIFIPKGVARSSVGELATHHFPGVPWDVVGKRSLEKKHETLAATEEADRVHDCGDVYVLVPHPDTVRWEPGPYGTECPLVPSGFSYRSDGEGG